MNDDAIIVYMKTQTDWEEDEITAKFKALRFFKGALDNEEMKSYTETLERLQRKG